MKTGLQSYEFAPGDFRDLLSQTMDRGVALRFAVNGTSMDPFIKSGDVVTVAPLPPRLAPGDIVAAVSPANGLVIVHRIVALRRGEALLKGDNLPAADGWAAGAAVLGRVARVERGGRQVTLGVARGNALVARLSRWDMLRTAVRICAVGASLAKR
jgi:hypothetical protein